ncbi:Myb-like DNA-binding domain containing protein [Histomonas meleagridis]|uniref:Myb-like DNA-binding domain containing protein n=1 Tax=Histomonas meleagridis TaxID=135588 RepID=UPI00355A6338|nr:Myb-like DNA-binding domain containing protein [Histomonas meleagridis]KAH0799713.1 Myb-like DNA-binding domain containing protein [Histomonas meleagridis]
MERSNLRVRAFNGLSEHWRKVLKPEIKKGSWTKDDDDKLRNHVHENGEKNWCVIGSILGRTGKQCRERWVSCLQPNIKSYPWTLEEDELLMKLVREMGRKWVQIGKFFPHRSVNDIKNRWYSNLKKKNEKELDTNLSMFDISGIVVELDSATKYVTEFSCSDFDQSNEDFCSTSDQVLFLGSPDEDFEHP